MNDASKTPSQATKCTVISCANFVTIDSPCQFFNFPLNRALSNKWKEKCGVAANFNAAEGKVCSEHFKPNNFDPVSKQLLPETLPTQNLNWMFGAPEYTLVQIDYNQVKEAVDENEQLKQQLEKLTGEIESAKKTIEYYDKRLPNIQKEIVRTEGLITRMSGKKRLTKADTNLISRVFSQAQINMLMGKKKVIWSYDDMAMAFTLRHVGNRECYLYLKNTLNIPLPSLSSVQKWIASDKLPR